MIKTLLLFVVLFDNNTVFEEMLISVKNRHINM